MVSKIMYGISINHERMKMNLEETTIVQYAHALAFAQKCSLKEAASLLREIVENHLVWVYPFGDQKEHLISYVKMINGAIHVNLKDNKSASRSEDIKMREESDRILTIQAQEMEFWD